MKFNKKTDPLPRVSFFGCPDFFSYAAKEYEALLASNGDREKTGHSIHVLITVLIYVLS